MSKQLIDAKELHAKWMKDPKYRKVHDALEAEYGLAAAVIEARSASVSSGRNGAAPRSGTRR